MSEIYKIGNLQIGDEIFTHDRVNKTKILDITKEKFGDEEIVRIWFICPLSKKKKYNLPQFIVKV
jgi:hypothetical protein